MADNDTVRFEDLLDRLEQIVRELENDELDLDRAIARYEEGMTLARECQRRLDDAERRVERIRRGEGGGGEVEPFEPEGEA